MNKKIIIFCVLLTLLSVKIFPQTMTLDEAIETVANNIMQQVLMKNLSEVFDFSSKTITVAILDFDCSSNVLSEYVSNDLTKYFLRNMKFTVVDRQNLDRARKELNFNKSLEVSEETAQGIGHFVGAQVVVFGSIKPLGNMYRMQARAITVEKAVVLAQESINIRERDIRLFADTKADRDEQKRQETEERRLERKRIADQNKRKAEKFWNDWEFFNGLFMLGYTYTPDLPVGFSFSLLGLYNSFNLGIPNWKGYNEHKNNKAQKKEVDYYSDPFTETTYQKIDWTIGYNITIIPNILYLPIGGGIASIKELRLQYYSYYNSKDNGYEWNRPRGDDDYTQYEHYGIFEIGLLLKSPNDVSPYISGTYRYKGGEHTFVISAGICGDVFN